MKTILLIFFIILFALILNNLVYRILYSHFSNLPLPHNQEHGLIIVLGAGVKYNQPSLILKDRLNSALNIYNKYPNSEIILTGAPQEIPIMQQWMLQNGVSYSKLLLDEKGLRTANSCFNLKTYQDKYDHYWIVTQKYHLPRALLLCNVAGIKALPYPSDLNNYQGMPYYQAREYLSQFVALGDMLVMSARGEALQHLSLRDE